MKNRLQILYIYSGRWYIANKILNTIDAWSSDFNNSHFQLKMIEKSSNLNNIEFVKQLENFSFLTDQFMSVVSSTSHISVDLTLTNLKIKRTKDLLKNGLDVIQYCYKNQFAVNEQAIHIFEKTKIAIENPKILDSMQEFR